LHTQSAAQTVDRIIEVFPPEQQNQMRSTLAESIRGVVAQTLFKRTDTKGRCAALEILIATPAVRNLIRERKTAQLASLMQMGRSVGMQSLDDAIMAHLDAARISAEDAYRASLDKDRFKRRLSTPVDDPFEA
jgi:twitching motility protein PilT